MNRALLLNTLGCIIPALLALTGGAWMLAHSFQLPSGVILQSVAVFTGLLAALSAFLPRHQPFTRFGPANIVTLVRAGIAALLAGLPGTSALPSTLGWLLAALAGLALILDGVDGWLARRSGLASPFGARFDMEVDAFFILVLAVLVWQLDQAGPWVILSGALRYAFVALGQGWPWLNQPLPPRRRRQTICVMQTAVLAVCLIPALTPPLTTGLAAGALGLLTISFAVDSVWLWRRRQSPSLQQP